MNPDGFLHQSDRQIHLGQRCPNYDQLEKQEQIRQVTPLPRFAQHRSVKGRPYVRPKSDPRSPGGDLGTGDVLRQVTI